MKKGRGRRKGRRSRASRIRESLGSPSAERLAEWDALEVNRVPIYPDVRDGIVSICFDCAAWSLPQDEVKGIVEDVFVEFADKPLGACYAVDTMVLAIFDMHWGRFHDKVTSGVYDTTMSACLFPDDISQSDVDGRDRVWWEALKGPSGVHPRYGHVLLWVLTTLPKSHPVRAEMESGLPDDMSLQDCLPRLSFDDMLHAIVLITMRLESLHGAGLLMGYVSNESEIFAEYLKIMDDVRGIAVI